MTETPQESEYSAHASLGTLIRARRIALGLTPKEFAEEIGRSELAVARIEHESLDPDVRTLEKCAQVLQIALSDLCNTSPGLHISRMRND